MSLEKILKTTINKAGDAASTVSDGLKCAVEILSSHPLSIALAGGYLDAQQYFNQGYTEQQSINLGIKTAVLAYSALRLIKDYFIEIKNKKIHTNLQDLAIENQVISAATAATAYTTAINTISSAKFNDSWLVFSMAYSTVLMLLKLTKYQKEIEQIYNSGKTEKKLIRQATDYILERPILPATIVGTAVFGHFIEPFSAGYKTDPAQAIATQSFLSMAATSAAYFMTQVLASVFHSKSTQCAKLTMKAKWQKFRGKYDQALQTLSELEKIVSSELSSKIQLQKADILLAQGKYEESMQQLQQCIYETKDAPRNPLEFASELLKMTGLPSVKNAIMWLLPFSKAKTKIGLACYHDGKINSANLFLEPHEKDKNIDADLAYLLFLDSTHQEIKLQKQLEKTITKIQGKDFARVAISSDEIFEYTSKGLSRTVIFKKSSRPLEKEYVANKLFHTAAKDKDTIMRPIAHTQIQKNDETADYILASRIKGKVLAECERDKNMLQKSIELLSCTTRYADARLTDLQREELEINYFRIFYNKFAKRITKDKELQKEIFCTGKIIPTQLSLMQRRIIHGNAHSKNIILAENEKLCLIDFGDSAAAHFGLDLEQITADICNDFPRLQVYEQALVFEEQTRTKESIKEYAYASAFKTAHLLGRSVKYCEQDACMRFQNLVSAVDLLTNLTGEKTMLETFMDNVKKSELFA